jgi:type VI secretion system protein ImpB
MSSIQGDLGKHRPPWVHITYDVHVGNAIEKKQLPFVVGVLADLSGDSRNKLPRLKRREFIDINKSNFNQILAGIGPTLNFQVKNLVQDNDSTINVRLRFESMDDFGPVRVAEQVAKTVEPVARLLELRRRIKRLLMTMEGNDALEMDVQRLINDRAALKQLCQEAGRSDPEPQEARP